jgi:glycosyltransferase involved in cell wall biosynthesis
MNSLPDVLYFGFVLGHAGDAWQMVDLAAGVRARGASVRVVVPKVETTEVLEQRCQGLNVPVVRTEDIRVGITGSRQSLPRLIRLFRTHRAPIVHFHTGDVALPRLALLAMNLLRYPRAFVTTQSPYDTLRPGDARARMWASRAPRRFHAIVCPSEHSRLTQRRYGVPEAALRCIRNSVDIARFAAGDRMAAFQFLGLPETERLIVFSSRIDGQKRPVEAVRAFAKVSGEFPDTRLVFVGSGGEADACKMEAAHFGLGDRVHFVGHQSNVPDWLAASTAWILPTERENFSLAVLEALAAGCAVVSTNCPGNDEVLINDRNAIAVRVGDVEAMAAGLRSVLGDEAIRRRLSSAARETAAQYSVDRMVSQYLDCYRSFAAEMRPALRSAAWL